MLVKNLFDCPRIIKGTLFEFLRTLPYAVRDHSRYAAVIIAILLRDSTAETESESVMAAYWGAYLHDIGKSTFLKTLIMCPEKRTPTQEAIYSNWQRISCEMFERYGTELHQTVECNAITAGIIALSDEKDDGAFSDSFTGPNRYHQAYYAANYMAYQIVGVDKRRVVKSKIRPAIRAALSFCQERGYEEIGKELAVKKREITCALEKATLL